MFSIGSVAGFISLGYLADTPRQKADHLALLPRSPGTLVVLLPPG